MTRHSDYLEQGVRLLVVPGLDNSGEDHWQTWLARQYAGSVRIAVGDWHHADLDRWAAAIDDALARHRGGAWVAVAHSFGCLALAHYAARGGRGVAGALLVAPASPERLGVGEHQVSQPLPFPSTLAVSSTDPWVSLTDALYFGQRWGSEIVELGDTGHVNPASGFGSWPAALKYLEPHRLRAAGTLHPRQRSAAPALGFAI